MKNWASKSVMGERVFLNRDNIHIPEIHDKPIHKILNLVSSSGMALAIWATVEYSIWGACFGIALAYIGKSWYLDRMVWLYERSEETRLNSSHVRISYAVFCLKKKKNK